MKKNLSTEIPRTAPPSAADARFMAMAFAHARLVKGKTLPNPAVGAVLVKNGRVVGQGGTRPAGQAHAEVVALTAAGLRAKGATLYVTLEPCNHFGRTPPCSHALVAAGVVRVVAACPDPNPKVSGSGFATLRNAGIAVEVAPPGSRWRDEAESFYAGFFFWLRHGRPRIVVKIAQSADGRINAAPGQQTPLTGLEAQRAAHALRASADAILVGGLTVRVDNPDLTPRLTGGPKPQVLVLTRGGSLDPKLKVFAQPRTPKTRLLAPKRPKNLPKWVDFTPISLEMTKKVAGATAAQNRQNQRKLAHALLEVFNESGYHEVLVEGGRAVWGPFLESGLCDVFCLLTAPQLLPRGEAWAKELGPAWGKPLEFHRFTPLDRDSLIEFRRRVSAR
jgi:diaminohydroxyphosphoribosylaminopyrimidine deaminase/5-amino-6-(5-phosphoribosylamino)uracil reductase